MSLLIAVKVFGDLCFFFSIVESMPLIFSHKMVLLLPALLCGVSAGLSVKVRFSRAGIRHGYLRYIPLLLAVSSLGTASTKIEWLILFPAVLYTVWIVHNGIFMLDYGQHYEMFFRTLKLWAVAFIVCFLVGLLSEILGEKTQFFDYHTMLFYAVLYGVSGVYLLRQLRLGTACSGKESAVNGGELITAAAIAGGLFGVLFLIRVIYFGGRDMVDELLRKISVLLSVGPALLNQWLTDHVFDDVPEFEEHVSQVVEGMTRPETAMPEGAFAVEEGPLVSPETAGTIYWWAAVVIILLLALLLWRLWKVFVDGSGKESRKAVLEETDEVMPLPALRISNREKVRRCYRDFLKMMERRRFARRPDQTSWDILESVEGMVSAEAAAALREVYICARYDEGREVTDEQVRQAKKALKELKKVPRS